MALYHDFAPQQEPLAKARAWSYPSPTPSFTQIKDYLCFYASSSTNPNTVGGWTCVRVEENRAKRKAMVLMFYYTFPFFFFSLSLLVR